jgi:hypothetical protein
MNTTHTSTDDDSPPTRLGGHVQAPLEGWAHVCATEGAGVLPPPITADLLRAAATPTPALLNGEDSADTWCATLRAVYAAGVAHYYPRSRATAAGIADARLMAAAHVLYDAHVAPAVWMRFSVEAWRAYPPQGINPMRAAPAPGAVWNAAIIVERVPWCRQWSAAWTASTVCLGPVARALVARHAALMVDIARSGATTRAAMAALVAQHFPGEDSWEECLADARREARGIQQRLDAAAARGVWPWNPEDTRA